MHTSVTLPIVVASKEDETEVDWEELGLTAPNEKEFNVKDAETQMFCFITIDYFYESDDNVTVIVSRGENLICPLPAKTVIKEMKKVGFIGVSAKVKKK